MIRTFLGKFPLGSASTSPAPFSVKHCGSLSTCQLVQALPVIRMCGKAQGKGQVEEECSNCVNQLPITYKLVFTPSSLTPLDNKALDASVEAGALLSKIRGNLNSN